MQRAMLTPGLQSKVSCLLTRAGERYLPKPYFNVLRVWECVSLTGLANIPLKSGRKCKVRGGFPTR